MDAKITVRKDCTLNLKKGDRLQLHTADERTHIELQVKEEAKQIRIVEISDN